jgi:hypothetical protein
MNGQKMGPVGGKQAGPGEKYCENFVEYITQGPRRLLAGMSRGIWKVHIALCWRDARLVIRAVLRRKQLSGFNLANPANYSRS